MVLGPEQIDETVLSPLVVRAREDLNEDDADGVADLGVGAAFGDELADGAFGELVEEVEEDGWVLGVCGCGLSEGCGVSGGEVFADVDCGAGDGEGLLEDGFDLCKLCEKLSAEVRVPKMGCDTYVGFVGRFVRLVYHTHLRIDATLELAQIFEAGVFALLLGLYAESLQSPPESEIALMHSFALLRVGDKPRSRCRRQWSLLLLCRKGLASCGGCHAIRLWL